MTDNERVVITSKTQSDLIGLIPGILTFRPQDSIVILMLRGKRVFLTARIDLADGASMLEVMDGGRKQGAERFFVAIYADIPNEEDAKLIEAIVSYARMNKGEIIDVAHVTGDHFSLPLCKDDGCCPLTQPITTTTLNQHIDLTGERPMSDREQLKADLAPRARQLVPITDPVILAKWIATAVCNQDATTVLFGAPTDETFEILGSAVQSITTRDAIMMVPGFERGPWSEVARAMPTAATYTMAAIAAYLNGNGALASIAIDYALEIDDEYSMGVLMQSALAGMVPPLALRLALRNADG